MRTPFHSVKQFMPFDCAQGRQGRRQRSRVKVRVEKARSLYNCVQEVQEVKVLVVFLEIGGFFGRIFSGSHGRNQLKRKNWVGRRLFDEDVLWLEFNRRYAFGRINGAWQMGGKAFGCKFLQMNL